MASNTMESVLNESEIMPSSPESNFDTSELLNTIAQRDEVMSKLASAGPVGECGGCGYVYEGVGKCGGYECGYCLLYTSPSPRD